MNLNRFEHMIMEEVADAGDVGVLGGGPVETPVETPTNDVPEDTPPSIYGDLEVKFPEGLEPEVQQSTFLKPFVDKESGEVNYSNLLKSYVHAQKNVHSSKAVIPGENATDQELDEFYSKLGYKVDEEEYVLEKPEGSAMPDEALGDFKKFARENRLPLGTAQKMTEYLDKTMSNLSTGIVESEKQAIQEGLESIKSEWGQAYEQKLGLAQRVLKDVVSEDQAEAFKDPRIGSNPAIIKLLAGLGEKLYKEDGFQGEAKSSNMFSPEEAKTKIDEIMADPAYWDKNNPRQKNLVAEVTRLTEMKYGKK